ncbi:MAG: sensor histidine kinase [Bacteroidetes bacterium]|nr:sensor histidine kinase [Bacteroidota bacterium]
MGQQIEDSSIQEKQTLDSLAILLLEGEKVNFNAQEFKHYPKYARGLEQVNNGTYTYKDFNELLVGISEQLEINPDLLNGLLRIEKEATKQKGQADSSYMVVLIDMVHLCRNLTQLVVADSFNNELRRYANTTNDKYLKTSALAHVQFHNTISCLIKRDVDCAKKEVSIGLNLANQTKDTGLIVTALYYESEVLKTTRNLPAFLQTCYKAYQLDSARAEKSSYYLIIMQNWLDGLIFSGADPDRVIKLIEELDKLPVMNQMITDFKLKFVASLPDESEYLQQVYERNGATNFLELVVALDSNAVTFKGQKYYTAFLTFAAKVLNAKGYNNEAMAYYDKALRHTQDMYSIKLSKELAEIETRKVVAEKDAQIAYEKERQIWLIILVSIAVGMLVVITLLFINKSRFAQRLTQSNNEIKQQQELLKKADAQKALMLKEMHHRVKNNFEVVKSLLDMQTRKVDEPLFKEMATESKNRLNAMALIHKRLYKNDELVIDFSSYLSELLESLKSAYAIESQITINETDLDLDIDTAIPLGLILNELATNAFKYGSKDGVLNLEISLDKKEDEKILIVKDEGPGLPEGLELGKSTSMGLKLIHRLSSQINGAVAVSNDNGAVFTIKFKGV